MADDISTSFEDASLDPNYQGDTGDFSHSSDEAAEGSKSLYSMVMEGTIYRTDQTTGQGSQYEWSAWVGPARWTQFIFGFQDTDNYYCCEYEPSELAIKKVEGGTWSTLASSGISGDSGAWVRMTLEWETGGDMTLTWDGGPEGPSANDTTWSSGGFGWTHFGGISPTEATYSDWLVYTDLGGGGDGGGGDGQVILL